MTINIATLIQEEGGLIGKDVLPVPEELKFHWGKNEIKQLNLRKLSGDKVSISARNDGGYRFIMDPAHGKYFMIRSGDLAAKIEKRLVKDFYGNISNRMPQGNAGYYAFIKSFSDPNLQKKFEAFQEWNSPEAEAIRKKAANRAAYRAHQMARFEWMDKEPVGVKDAIREMGFSPNSYVEIKDGMEMVGLLSGRKITVELPKVEDLSAQYFVCNGNNNIYVIGDGKDVLLTHDMELVNQLRSEYLYESIPDAGRVMGDWYGDSFTDAKLQKKYEQHKQYVKKMRLEIERAQKHFGKSEKEVLAMRRAERMSKRNLTVKPLTAQQLSDKKYKFRNSSAVHRQRARLEAKAAAARAAAEAAAKEQAQKPKKPIGLIARLFGRGGRR